MPKPNEQQAVFVTEYVATGGNGAKAARRAKYSKKSAAQVAYQLLQKPHILVAIHAEQARQICGEIATLAVHVLLGILKDKTAKDSVRLDAAKIGLALAGHVSPKAPEPDDGHQDRPMSEWTSVELEEFIRKGRSAIDGADKSDEKLYEAAKKNNKKGDESESVH